MDMKEILFEGLYNEMAIDNPFETSYKNALYDRIYDNYIKDKQKGICESYSGEDLDILIKEERKAAFDIGYETALKMMKEVK